MVVQHRRSNGKKKESTTSTDANGKNYEGVVENEAQEAVPVTGFPAWHTLLLLALFVSFFTYTLPSFDTLDEIAVIQTFAVSLFPITVFELSLIRAAIAFTIFCTTITTILSKGWYVHTPYMKGSKVKASPILLSGVKTMFPFTSWCWNLLGFNFALSSFIAYRASMDHDVGKHVLRAAVLSWQVSAPCTLLVASAVRYAIWPAVLKKSRPHELGSFRNIMMHNMNVVFAMTESCLLSGMPVRWSEAGMAALWGCVYVMFTWSMMLRWCDAKHGPQFIYHFVDTTLPGYLSSMALAILLVVLLFFHGLFCTNEIVLDFVGGGFVTNATFVILISSLVMRFRD